jgi:UDP-glucose 4-epimerase
VTAVAVVGSAGFIGRATCAALRSAGVDVAEFPRDVPFLDEDGRPTPRLRTARSIFYLASNINPGLAESRPDLVAEDLDQFDALLAALSVDNERRLVVVPSSGGTCYDPRVPPPYSEKSPTAPVTAYGQARLHMETLLAKHRQPHGLRGLALRISNVYGPGQRAGTGQGVIAHWLASALHGRPLHVFGDVDAQRDYVFLGDVARAFQLADEAFAADRLENDVLNIGSGVPTSLAQVIEVVREVVAQDVRVVYDTARSFDRQGTWLDVCRAAEVLGWSATTPLAEGVARQWAALTGEEAR